MTFIPQRIREEVIRRARGCCEYCLLNEEDHFFAHEIDHIIAEKHRGETTPDNLCLSCFDCNRHKGSDIASIDEFDDSLTPLFNPRIHQWHDHFRLETAQITPLTAIGRVTVFLLQLNAHEQIVKRRALIGLERYPCNPGE